MAGQRIRCEPQETSLIWLDHIGHWLGPATASLSGILYHGYRVQLANPHWVLLQQVTPAWLACHGKTLERAFLPETLINVEFVWLDPQGIWQVQLFERGVGMTAASGSGAMAIHRTLLELGKITPNEWINLQMPGGMLSTYWDGARYGLRGAVHPFGKRLL